MNIEVITDDYGSMGRVIGSELHITVETKRLEHPYSNDEECKQEEKRLIKLAEKLKKEIEIAMRTKELVEERIKKLDKLLLTEHPLEHIGGCEYKQRREEFQSIVDEANSYIMKDVSDV